MGFITRILFLQILSSEYLGVNGLFSSILSILALAELGVGSAISYSLYKPLADKDFDAVYAIMNLFKKAYRIIGAVVFAVGVTLIPFLPYIINDETSIENINIIYLLFLANTAVSYFYTYKSTLVIADQKKYLTTNIRNVFIVISNVARIAVLFITRNYLIYLVTIIFFTLLENIVISLKADKLYPFLKDKGKSTEIEPAVKEKIIKNVKGGFIHKIGSAVVYSTDNIIISSYIGLIEVGIYSNYLLVVSAIEMITGILFNSITASVGNLNAFDKDRARNLFSIFNFASFLMFTFFSACLLNLLNPFINEIWLAGQNLIFPMEVVIVIVMRFWFTGLRQIVLTFRNSLGLFWEDRYKPIFESVINLVASITLAIHFGITGVFIGTILSTVLTCTWSEPYILFKHGFKHSPKQYYLKTLYYTLTATVICATTIFVCGFIPFLGILGFLVKGIVCTIIFIVLSLIFFGFTKDFKDTIEFLKDILKNTKFKFLFKKSKS